MHWAERWLGRPWDEETYDCAHFVEEVLREAFGRNLRMPAHAADPRQWDRQIEDLRDGYATPTPSPRDGDGALMHALGARHGRRWHLGLAAIAGGSVYVLHCQQGSGSVLHPVAELRGQLLELEGWYRWTRG